MAYLAAIPLPRFGTVGVELIRDPYSKASQGVVMTWVALWDAKVAFRASAYSGRHSRLPKPPMPSAVSRSGCSRFLWPELQLPNGKVQLYNVK